MNKIAIHGLGYVGLTAAVHWAKAGWTVIGYDPDEATIEKLKGGRPRAKEFLGYLDADVAELVQKELIQPTLNFDDTLKCPVQSIAVPTERNGEPYDLIVERLLKRLLLCTESGTTILVESTLSPGTIDRVLRGPDFLAVLDGRHLAVCPRRDWFADAAKNLETLPRVVGGVTPDCTNRARELLLTVSREIQTTDYRTAELTKALENALLHVMVMLPTELAINASDLNVAEALKLAGSHWRIPELYLGFGTGGRCVPLGTRYLQPLISTSMLPASAPASLFEAAIDTDADIRQQAANAIALRDAKTALVLGISYRPSFRDAGLSPGLGVAKALVESGVKVAVADPMWSETELAELTGLPVAAEPAAENFDAVLLAMPHPEFVDWPENQTWRKGQIVLDAQGTWSKFKYFFETGEVQYHQVGMAGWLP